MNKYFILLALLVIVGCSSIDNTVKSESDRWSEPQTISLMTQDGPITAYYYPNDEAVTSIITNNVTDEMRSNSRILVVEEEYFNSAEEFLERRGFTEEIIYER